MNATLPIGKNFINAPSTMTTANVGALIPFTSRRYQDPGGIYWGVDAESEDFIMLDRTALGAPHQMVFGITGSGKSFGLCRENLQILLRRPRAKVYIASPGSHTSRSFSSSAVNGSRSAPARRTTSMSCPSTSTRWRT